MMLAVGGGPYALWKSLGRGWQDADHICLAQLVARLDELFDVIIN